ncbi:MAG: (Fe-S)-binding protein, partial [Bacteroidota bacterium]|nr:(Fe-S)-binding protein [Bacteroidota bacterium]
MIALWIIFPSRLFAESFTAGAYGYGGGFITQHFGNLLAFLWPLSDKGISYFIWWIYSLSLGVFFVMLPYTRYMHIPTELMLILFRHFGITSKKEFSAFSEVELYACSRCGVCIDVCQLNTSAGITNIQSTYFLQSVRDQQVNENLVQQCLVCGRCSQVCPVGINTDNQRIFQRQNFNGFSPLELGYLPVIKAAPAEIAYFGGCMTRLTPGISRAMIGIFHQAQVNYTFLDQDKSICCGRPLQLAGKEKQAKDLIQSNRNLIAQSNAKALVTSCPICLRIFQKEYNLDIPVFHHSQFILELVKTGRIPLQSYFRKIAYHDPCELGRGSGIYSEPRELLIKVADLVEVEKEKEDSLCCGGSLGLVNADQRQRDCITRDTLEILLKSNPELLITACPLCKKTFAGKSNTPVMDIAELIYNSIPEIHNRQ